MRNDPASLVPIVRIERRILVLRGQKVLLDSDLGSFYGVPTKALNQAAKRNRARFPPDFMFRLTYREVDALLRSQFVTSKRGRGGRRYLPYAFTEQGVAMLSSVLKSERAILANVAIMRAFVRLRHLVASHLELARELAAMRRELARKVHRQTFDRVIRRLLDLFTPDSEAKTEGSIGFRPAAVK
ncbi:MAG: ORF6N domain-containing protein [Planctomycetes bacterium]|nr:ORF6N domain-containing protein [Planctomycetota bacterium]